MTSRTRAYGMGGAWFCSRAMTARTSGVSRSGSMLICWPIFMARPFKSPSVATSFSAAPALKMDVGSSLLVKRFTPRDTTSVDNFADMEASFARRANRPVESFESSSATARDRIAAPRGSRH